MIELVPTICPYCGAGCGILLAVENGRAVRTLPWAGHPVSEGKLCIKGRRAHEFVHHPERLTKPLVREGERFREASWEEALDLVAKGLWDTRERHGPDALGFCGSAKCTNEENYLLQKLARAVFGTNNIDHCARLCHAPTVAGLAWAFGSGAMTNSISDIEEASCIFVIGSDTSSQHPLIASRVMRAKERGAKLIVADPRRIHLALFADVYLPLRPGSEVMLLGAMAKVIVDEGLLDEEFVRGRTEGFEEFRESLKLFSLERVQDITGVPAEDIRNAALLYARAERSAILYAMGITQHSHGTQNVLAVADLAMLTGNIGKPGTGVNPLRGQNNVQGACDVGALPGVLPGYRSVTDPQALKSASEVWGVSNLPSTSGLTLPELMKGALEGKIKAMLIMGENPVISDPDRAHTERALSNLEFLAVLDIFLTETARFAHVVLPAASFAEKEGTFTNTERRVQLLRRAVNPPGEAKPDWEIISLLGKKLGAERLFPFSSPEEIFEELRKITPQYAGMNCRRLGESMGLQWPCPSEDHPGTPILHTKEFTRGKGRFAPLIEVGPAERPDEEFPLILTTGRVMSQFHTGTMTRRSPSLEREFPKCFVEINPEDAQKFGVRDGDEVEIISRRGSVRVEARVSERIRPGVVYIPFHYAEAAANALTSSETLDPQSKIPEFKVSAVKIRPVR